MDDYNQYVSVCHDALNGQCQIMSKYDISLPHRCHCFVQDGKLYILSGNAIRTTV